jgi:choline-glycine betaine transporter
MTLVAIAWVYVVLLMALAEAMSPQGSVLGAVATLLLYGALPLSIVLYIMATPARRARRQQAEADAAAATASAASPDGSGHAPGDPVPPEGKES